MDAINVMGLHRTNQEISLDKIATHTPIVVGFRPQKQDPNRVCIIVEETLIVYSDKLTTQTADRTFFNLFVEYCYQHRKR